MSEPKFDPESILVSALPFRDARLLRRSCAHVDARDGT
jgi:hypothetical protein